MKRLVLALLSISISQVLPLLFKPEMILHERNLVLIAANLLIWLTQPPVSVEETKSNQSSDKNSVLIIIVCSMISVIAPIVDWAYFGTDTYQTSWTVLGLVLIVFGIALRAWSVQKLGRHFTATVQLKDDHKLITKGPYAIVRHPSYSGALTAIVGSAVFLNSLVGTCVAFFFMMLAYYIRINIEEKVLFGKFGERYSSYQKRTRKLIPFIW
jgi:protein-S-isoprenylcysteine O-methyltransferase Ste14